MIGTTHSVNEELSKQQISNNVKPLYVTVFIEPWYFSTCSYFALYTTNYRQYFQENRLKEISSLCHHSMQHMIIKYRPQLFSWSLGWLIFSGTHFVCTHYPCPWWSFLCPVLGEAFFVLVHGEAFFVLSLVEPSLSCTWWSLLCPVLGGAFFVLSLVEPSLSHPWWSLLCPILGGSFFVLSLGEAFFVLSLVKPTVSCPWWSLLCSVLGGSLFVFSLGEAYFIV